MTCHHRGPFIVCTRAPAKRCKCGARADKLCDYPIGQDKTCDKPICDRHAIEQGPGIDYCLTHAAMPKSNK